MDSITISYAKINTDTTKRIPAAKLRGYLGYLFIQDTEFHHHDDNPYRYPLIQYKRINDELFVLGINDYSKVILEKLSSLENIVLPNFKVSVTSIEFSTITHTITDKTTQYKFMSPWIALNSENYNLFKTVDHRLRYRFLENILVGNFLSTLKGIGIHINHKLYTNINGLRPMYAIAHQNPFYAFYAQFTTNLNLPDLIGIGNSVSKGFGVIKKIWYPWYNRWDRVHVFL